MIKKAWTLIIVVGLALLSLITLATYSYVQPHILSYTTNEYGEQWVYDEGPLRCLSFVPPGTYVQGCIHRAAPNELIYPYLQLMLGALYLNQAPRSVLIIGLGTASIARALGVLLPEATIDIVELNAQLVDFSQQFFLFEPTDRMKITVADGFDYMKRAKKNSYDLIVIDAFGKEYIPPSFLTSEFLRMLYDCLGPNGVVAVNTFNESPTYAQESSLYEVAFGGYYNLVTSINRIIIAQKGRALSLKDIRQSAEVWHLPMKKVGVDSEWIVSHFNKA